MDGNPAKIQLSIRIPASMATDIGHVASALERDRTWVILRALRCYFEGDGADILQDAAGLSALDRGEGRDFDEVMAEAEGIIADAAERLTKAG
jgi:predicted transcriptional regulator